MQQQQQAQAQQAQEDSRVATSQRRKSRALRPVDRNSDLSLVPDSGSEAESREAACGLHLVPAGKAGWPFGLSSPPPPSPSPFPSPFPPTNGASGSLLAPASRASTRAPEGGGSTGSEPLLKGSGRRSEDGSPDCGPIRDCHVEGCRSEGSPSSGWPLGLSASAAPDLSFHGGMVGDGNMVRVQSSIEILHPPGSSSSSSSREEAQGAEPLLRECVKAVTGRAFWRVCMQGRADDDDDEDDDSEEGARSESTDYGDDASVRGDRQGGECADWEPGREENEVNEGIELISTERWNELEGVRGGESVVLEVRDSEEASVGECESVCESVASSVWSARTGGGSVSGCEGGDGGEGRGKKGDAPLLSLVFGE